MWIRRDEICACVRCVPQLKKITVSWQAVELVTPPARRRRRGRSESSGVSLEDPPAPKRGRLGLNSPWPPLLPDSEVGRVRVCFLLVFSHTVLVVAVVVVAVVVVAVSYGRSSRRRPQKRRAKGVSTLAIWPRRISFHGTGRSAGRRMVLREHFLGGMGYIWASYPAGHALGSTTKLEAARDCKIDMYCLDTARWAQRLSKHRGDVLRRSFAGCPQAFCCLKRVCQNKLILFIASAAQSRGPPLTKRSHHTELVCPRAGGQCWDASGRTRVLWLRLCVQDPELTVALVM